MEQNFHILHLNQKVISVLNIHGSLMSDIRKIIVLTPCLEMIFITSLYINQYCLTIEYKLTCYLSHLYIFDK